MALLALLAEDLAAAPQCANHAHHPRAYGSTPGTSIVGSFRRTRRVVFASAAATFAVMIADGDQHGGLAQGKLDARYSVTLAGLPVGKGEWTVDLGDDHFTAAANGGTSGLMRVFTSGHGESTARGAISGGQLVSSNYAANVFTDRKYDEIRMVIQAGTVKEFAVEPPTVMTPDRVPLTEAHRRGVADPMTASIMRVPGTGDPLVPQTCQRTLSIFDGRMRYDLQLAFKRLDRVKSEIGYQGTVVVCAVRYVPIAGHIPERAAIKYLAGLSEMEMWLAPIFGTRVVVPYRVSIPTPLGTGVLQATQFVSAPQPAKASAKTQ
jgi:hypothetical protein